MSHPGSVKIHAVIMAGGSGTRFWPLSRHANPKQFLAIGTKEPLLRETITRLHPLVTPERVHVVAGAHHAAQVRALLPELSASALLVEPCARNTAPCVGLAALHVARLDPDAVMAVLPADHHIADGETFRRLVAGAAERAAQGELVTLGISPTRPETGYGYIQRAAEPSLRTEGDLPVYEVLRFVEKPALALAERYLAEGDYLWNSGMFFMTPRRILSDIERFLPELAAQLARIDAAIGAPDYEAVLAECFTAAPAVSLDFGVMERAENVRVIAAQMGWNDVGHWAALPDFSPTDGDENVIIGDALLRDCEGVIAHSEAGLTVAALGLRDLVVVATADVVMICPRARAQEVRVLGQALAEAGREELL